MVSQRCRFTLSISQCNLKPTRLRRIVSALSKLTAVLWTLPRMFQTWFSVSHFWEMSNHYGIWCAWCSRRVSGQHQVCRFTAPGKTSEARSWRGAWVRCLGLVMLSYYTPTAWIKVTLSHFWHCMWVWVLHAAYSIFVCYKAFTNIAWAFEN